MGKVKWRVEFVGMGRKQRPNQTQSHEVYASQGSPHSPQFPTANKLLLKHYYYRLLLLKIVQPMPTPIPALAPLTPQTTPLVLHCLLHLSSLPASAPFLHPIPPSQTHYHSIIAQPICLDFIIQKVHSGGYSNVGQVKTDLRLIAKNCLRFCRGREFEGEMQGQVGRWVRAYERVWMGLAEGLRKKTEREGGVVEMVSVEEADPEKQGQSKDHQLDDSDQISEHPSAISQQIPSDGPEQAPPFYTTGPPQQQHTLTMPLALPKPPTDPQPNPSLQQPLHPCQTYSNTNQQPQYSEPNNSDQCQSNTQTISMANRYGNYRQKKKKQCDSQCRDEVKVKYEADQKKCMKDMEKVWKQGSFEAAAIVIKQQDQHSEYLKTRPQQNSPESADDMVMKVRLKKQPSDDSNPIPANQPNSESHDPTIVNTTANKLQKYHTILTKCFLWLKHNILTPFLRPGQPDYCYMQLPSYFLQIVNQLISKLNQNNVDMEGILHLEKQLSLWYEGIAEGYLEERLRSRYDLYCGKVDKCLRKVGWYWGWGEQGVEDLRGRVYADREGEYVEGRVTRARRRECWEGSRLGRFVRMLREDQDCDSLRIRVVREGDQWRVADKKDERKCAKNTAKLQQPTPSQPASQQPNPSTPQSPQADDPEHTPRTRTRSRRPDKQYRPKNCTRGTRKILRTRRALQQYQQQKQLEQSAKQLQEDLQFIEQYSLRSNSLIVEKYASRLCIDWFRVMTVEYPIPECIDFGEEETDVEM